MDYIYYGSLEWLKMSYEDPEYLSSRMWLAYKEQFDLRNKDLNTVIVQNQRLPPSEFRCGFNLAISLYRRKFDFKNCVLVMGFSRMTDTRTWNLDFPSYMIRVRLASLNEYCVHPSQKANSFQVGLYDGTQNLTFSYNRMIPLAHFQNINQDLPLHLILITDFGELSLLHDPRERNSLENTVVRHISSNVKHFNEIDSLEVIESLRDQIKLCWIRDHVICVNYS